MKEVKIGNQGGDKVEILSGLKPGDEIVVKGVFTVDASAQLQGKPTMLNKNMNKSSGMKGHIH